MSPYYNYRHHRRNPWSARDVKRHNKRCADRKACRRKWPKIANAVLRESGDKGKAIRIANWQVKRMGLRRRNPRSHGEDWRDWTWFRPNPYLYNPSDDEDMKAVDDILGDLTPCDKNDWGIASNPHSLQEKTHWGHTDRHYMAKANCKVIAEYGDWLWNTIKPGDVLADWMEYYLSVAATYISDAYHAWEGMADQYRARSRVNPHGASYMSRKNCYRLAEYASKLYDLIHEGESLPDWMEHKIAVARRYVGDVKHSIEYQQHSRSDH